MVSYVGDEEKCAIFLDALLYQVDVFAWLPEVLPFYNAMMVSSNISVMISARRWRRKLWARTP